jgi:hypothetical protein
MQRIFHFLLKSEELQRDWQSVSLGSFLYIVHYMTTHTHKAHDPLTKGPPWILPLVPGALNGKLNEPTACAGGSLNKSRYRLYE